MMERPAEVGEAQVAPGVQARHHADADVDDAATPEARLSREGA